MDQTVPEVSQHEEMGQAASPPTESETTQEAPPEPVQRDSAKWHRIPGNGVTLSVAQICATGAGAGIPASDATAVHCPHPHDRGQPVGFSRSIDFSVKNENRPDHGWQPLGEVMRRVVGDVVARLRGDTVSLTD
jgi:hypothetical protein